MDGREYSRRSVASEGYDPGPLVTDLPPPSDPPIVRSPLLAFDTGSPLTSVAFARDGVVIAEQALERTATSESLLATIDAVLARAGASPRDLRAVCVLRGPGSFTGLRIGLATALGLHQALAVPVAAMPTLRVLAECAAAATVAARIVAVVDALRGEWFAQVFDGAHAPEEEEPPRLLDPSAIRALDPAVVVGFGAPRLAAAAKLDDSVEIREPGGLAAVAARLATTWPVWDASLLTQPLYLRPAPTTPAPPR
jgi:tRNA threonylcarbamoyladenosine biosynthesis protein TsaB